MQAGVYNKPASLYFITSKVIQMRTIRFSIQSNLSKPNPRRTAPIVRFSEVFGFPSVGFLVIYVLKYSCIHIYVHT